MGGGAKGIRTPDLYNANVARYQLCYSPLFGNFSDHILHLVGFRCFRGGSAQVAVRSTNCANAPCARGREPDLLPAAEREPPLGADPGPPRLSAHIIYHRSRENAREKCKFSPDAGDAFAPRDAPKADRPFRRRGAASVQGSGRPPRWTAGGSSGARNAGGYRSPASRRRRPGC